MVPTGGMEMHQTRMWQRGYVIYREKPIEEWARALPIKQDKIHTRY